MLEEICGCFFFLIVDTSYHVNRKREREGDMDSVHIDNKQGSKLTVASSKFTT